jgi:putative tributyrin esterase
MKIFKSSIFAPILLLVFALSLTFTVQAQKAKPKKEETAVFSVAPNASILQTEYLRSGLLSRQVPYNIVLPFDYNLAENKAKRYPVIYLLHGLTGNYSNWAAKTDLTRYAFERDLIIVTPEGENGWYSDSATAANDKYESYIIRELIPEIDKKFRTLAARENRAIAGLSMGGYGSIKFGLKYPEMFSIVGSFSGALGAASLSAKNAGAIGKSIDRIFGADDSETRKSNDIFRIVREASTEKIKTFPFIYFDCGTEDFLFQNNREFAALLVEKKIPHEYRQLPGRHDWNFWNSQVLEFLRVSERFVSKPMQKSAG